MPDTKLHIGIVAGEKSGDMLGAGLIVEIKKQYPQARFSGLGGDAMITNGFDSIASMERLSVMGLIEPLKRLPDLIRLRHDLLQHFLQQQISMVIGIDSPDFNLGLEKKLKRQGITTCHYVCPSVWAWRQGRVKKIRESVDHVLALLPFEAQFLKDHHINATFVGHPLADKLSKVQTESQVSGHSYVGGQHKKTRLCLMPGSRQSEVNALLDTFLATASLCFSQKTDLDLVIPAATQAIEKMIGDKLATDYPELLEASITVKPCFSSGQSQECMLNADVILLASGTATLEAALLGKPMVVAYKMSTLGYWIARKMVKVGFIALPNLLLDRKVVPEFIQDDASPQSLAEASLHLLNDVNAYAAIQQDLAAVKKLLTNDADRQAANVVISLCHPSGD